jgi:hypothetical protein
VVESVRVVATVEKTPGPRKVAPTKRVAAKSVAAKVSTRPAATAQTKAKPAPAAAKKATRTGGGSSANR